MGEEGQAGRQLARTTVVHLETEGAKNRPRKSSGCCDTDTTIDSSRHQLTECFLERFGNCNLVKNARVGCQRSREEGIRTVCLSLSLLLSGSAAKKGQKAAAAFRAPHPVARPKCREPRSDSQVATKDLGELAGTGGRVRGGGGEQIRCPPSWAWGGPA